MSKRLLPGPHADRSAGVDFGMSSTPNETPQRATAAQMATRKIKELNRRRPKPAGSPGPQTPFSFGEPNPTAGGPSTNPPGSNGFSFGQSQSFPGAGNSSAATQNGTQSVSFGAGGSSNFNFGGFNSSNNPFANLNGGSASSQPQTQTSNLFGGQSSTQPSNAMSGQNQSQGVFGQSSAAPSTSGAIFQSQPAGTGSNLFGQTTATTGSGFQSKTASTGLNLFGQSTPTSTGTPNIFGQSNSSASPTTQPAATTTPSLFGQSKPAAVGPTLFGQNPPATTTGSANIFGQPSANGPSTGSQSTASGPSLFDQSTATTSAPLFQSKPTATGSPSLFGQSTTTSKPGASLFGQSTAAKTEGASLFTPSTPNKPSASGQTSAAPANLFNFGQSATTTQKPIFGVTNDVDDMSTSPDGKHKTTVQASTAPFTFGQKPAQTSDPSEATRSTSSLFAPSSPTKSANPPASTTGSSGNLFGQPPSRSTTPNGISATASSVFAPATAATAPSSNPFQSLFTGASTPASTTTAAPATSAAPFKPLFTEASKQSTAEEATAPVKSTAATSSASSQPLFASAPRPQPQPAQTETTPVFASQTPSKRLGAAIMDQAAAAPSTSLAPTRPSSIDSLDSNKRSQIRDLNRGFKELVSAYDPENQSLDSIILHYIRLRKTIGAPVGSLTNKPGKRKIDDAHGIQSPAQQTATKKSKAQETPAAPEPQVPSFNVRPSLAGKRKPSGDAEDGSNGKRRAQPYERPTTFQPTAGGKSETSSIFASSFSSGSKDKVESQEPKQPTATNGSSLFGLKPATVSETAAPRPASPEKKLPEPAAKPAFEVPKFGNLGGNSFAGQFGQGSFKQSSTATPKVNIDVPKFGATGQNFMNQFVQQAKDDDSDDDSDSDEEPVEKEAEKPVEKPVEKPAPVMPQPQTTSSIFDSKPSTPAFTGNNIFGHLTNSNTTSDAGESSDDDITGQLKKRAKKAQSAAETEQANEPKPASSLFGRITRVDGTPVHVSSDEEKAETPKPTSLFGQSTTSTFLAAPNNTPSLFSSTPASKSSSIFGGSQPTSNPFSSINPNPAAHLFPKQGGTSTASVTSDSNAEETDTESYKDTQLNLMTNAGEEDEQCLYEGRSRALKYADKPTEGGKTEKSWEVQGVGQLRLLVNKETQRARFVFRAEPSGRAVLNTAISRAINYKVQPGSCSFLVPRADGSGMDMWALRFKKEVTEEFEKALTSAKDNLPK